MKTNKTCAILADIKKIDDLLPLTTRRPVSLLPFDSIYRMIDFNLSNVIDADIHSIYMIFNQGMTQSVIDHISGGKEWNLSSLPNRYFMHFFEGLQEREPEDDHYYDSVIEYIEKSDSEFTVFMGNKMLCNLDLSQVKNVHKMHREDITVVYKKMPKNQIAAGDIILDISKNGKVEGISTAKNMETELDNLFMNICIVKSDWLIQELKKWRTNEDIVTIEDVLKDAMKSKTTWAFEYTGYLSNIFDIKSYYDANMEMLESTKFLSLLHSSKKIYMKNINEVPTYYSKSSSVSNSQIAAGCLIYGNVSRSLISSGTIINEEAEVNNSIIMAKSTIKKNAIVRYAILDKNVVIDEGVQVIGTSEKPIVIKKNAHIVEDVIQMEEQVDESLILHSGV
ncbi:MULTISPECIES: glucose-1-phosphate adenylyltransferase subunit GlgD [Vagococcus]|uniref:Glycogen biosynthesis protein GlgD, glucose-1-phosphate adenylyltransferase family n=1 Tax=Vagococcus fluvialis bH819 TaxID=1255619 RepID=A0A1X6WNH3_9ENTE|nr:MULTISPECIES: glucose-1-phosphate adenylyltransferase subunit GlgD [Vagococcus]SLM85825.1 Glycogen biosynthesis protein GlgD, glucose-1-phosphate adenylyltransferase family [Vagococcus fluvialis bH819]HCM90247.1 glucose-1-phosphate adenylyltransferase subunit GlgD [Vagococcus sp.]